MVATVAKITAKAFIFQRIPKKKILFLFVFFIIIFFSNTCLSNRVITTALESLSPRGRRVTFNQEKLAGIYTLANFAKIKKKCFKYVIVIFFLLYFKKKRCT